MSSYKYDTYNSLSTNEIMLIGNPQITYFSSVYRRYTNFSINTHTSSRNNNSQTYTFEYRKSEGISPIDLILNVAVGYNIAIDDNNKINPSTKILDNVSYNSLEGDNSKIELISGSYIEMLSELSNPINYSINNNDNIVTGNLFNIINGTGGVICNTNSNIKVILNIPFSFSSNPGNALPLIALKIGINFTVNFTTNTNTNCKFYMRYITLYDTDLKLRFTSKPLEYILTRVYQLDFQKSVFNGNRFIIRPYNIYNNIKSIMWKPKKPDSNDYNNIKYNIKVNNLSVFNSDSNYIDNEYFTKVFPSKAGLNGCGRKKKNDTLIFGNNVHYYTFGLKDTYDNENTPTGSINSSVNNIEICVDEDSLTRDINMDMYIVTYNIIEYNNEKVSVKFTQKSL